MSYTKFKIISLIVVGVLIILLAVSGYFNYRYYKLFGPIPFKQQDTQAAQESFERTITGTIVEISADKIKIKSLPGEENNKEWDIVLTNKTIYQKTSLDAGAYQQASLGDYKKDNAVMIWLTGKNTDQKLTAEKIIKLP